MEDVASLDAGALPGRWQTAPGAARRAKAAWELEVLVLLVVKEFNLQYRGAVLGVAWSLINPILLMGVYTLLFTSILKSNVQDYPVFLLAGLIPWTFFSSGLSGAANALVAHLPILKVHRVPTWLFPAASCIASSMNLLLALTLFAAYRVCGGCGLACVVWVPALLAVQLLFTFGLGLGLSMLNVFHRDVHQAMLFVVRVWFFLTPVVYTAGQVPAHLQNLLWLNPMSGLVTAYRTVLVDGAVPDPVTFIPALALGIVLTELGRRLCRTLSPYLAEA